ncbi:MAG: RluA family pseudouridine synthase [Holosporaceae bacterium]|jgi:23S rRNA pseudouridine955/2504/2580 synthase|nr:RluA family pseudouridine synthase [Holosporaceae bacterium]
MPSLEHIITLDEDDLRADNVVKKNYSGVGYAFLQKLFRLNKVKINGKKSSAAVRVHVGDVLEIFANLAGVNERNHEFDQKMLDRLRSMIIYEDENIFAINKPSGLSVQLGTKVSISVETLLKSYPDCKCHLVHRLDKDTSGVLLIAKNQKFARLITGLFRENKIKKAYLAVVDGKISSSGTIDNFLEKSFVSNEEKMRVSSAGQRAITTYKPLKHIGNNTLLELKPFTGRKHQLRVHCATALNAPILGDRKYNKNFSEERLLLHAHKVFINDLKIKVIAEIPEYFKKIISSAKEIF